MKFLSVIGATVLLSLSHAVYADDSEPVCLKWEDQTFMIFNGTSFVPVKLPVCVEYPEPESR
jgi:hypothetical protein